MAKNENPPMKISKSGKVKVKNYNKSKKGNSRRARKKQAREKLLSASEREPRIYPDKVIIKRLLDYLKPYKSDAYWLLDRKSVV